MLYRKLLLFFIFTIFSLKAFSAVFVVTTNADSGPGTLRDALTQAAANGSATQDIIQFNLADTSQTGRTITILTDLPQLSSNLVIDASTQPGNNFGISGAKVKIVALLNTNYTVTCCFNLSDQSYVEVYGFLMDAANLNSATVGNGVSGIYGVLVKNAIIGAPGKGNIIKNLAGVVLASNGNETDTTISENIKISSNILALSEDGETLAYSYGSSIFADRVRNLTIGGNTAAEGNVIEGQANVTEDDVDFNVNTGDLLVANNFFGVDYTGTKPVFNLTSGSSFSIASYQLKTVVINKNLFVAQSDVGIGGLNCFFKITSNKFGTDITGTKVLGLPNFALVLGYCNGGGIIGGNNPDDGNIFSGAYFAEKIKDPSGVLINVGTPGVELVGNSFKCNNSTLTYSLEIVGSLSYYATINNRTANIISGTATPNSRVDLYYSLSCDHCEPEQQFTSVNSDNGGLWSYTGQLSGENIIASSTFQGTTSEFTRTSIGTDSVKITNACPGGTGSITGTIPINVTSLQWVDSLGNVVGTNANLTGVKPGKYKLKAQSFGCGDSTSYFEIKNKFQLDISTIVKTEPSCGNSLGSISGMNIINNDPGAPATFWLDASGKVLANTTMLNNAPAGDYYFLIKSADSTCSQKYGPFTLKNVTGPNIDQSNVAIQSTNCGQSTGSITGITATGTGTLSYIWWNSQQQNVGATVDLLNQPAGSYKLEVTDNSQCGPVYTTDITIPETNGITMDESGAQTAVASCSADNGSVTGIVVSGATQYQWVDANGKVIATTPGLQNAAPGNYTLTASNSFGCTETSKTYTVGQQLPTKFPVYPSSIYQACTGKANGGVNVPVDTLVTLERWVNSLGETVNDGIGISNVPAGIYQLYLTDQHGCETLYATYEVPSIPQLVIEPGSGQVTNDACSLNQGGITGIQVSGGRPPYTFAWLDANGNKISSSADISGLSAGNYTFTVNDQTTCGIISAVYTIQDQDVPIPAPVVNNLQVCGPGSAILQVKDPSQGSGYRLYDSETSTTPMDQQPGGNFNINVKSDITLYVSQFSGTCESPRTPVQVTVGISALDIANTFTPNGDGINDYWKIASIENYPNAIVQVFTRYGQKIFESKGYATPFDGTYGGKRLPDGVYYYIINLNTNCNLLSGSLTIIR
jgi:gliding motility-associated-like protein